MSYGDLALVLNRSLEVPGPHKLHGCVHSYTGLDFDTPALPTLLKIVQRAGFSICKKIMMWAIHSNLVHILRVGGPLEFKP